MVKRGVMRRHRRIYREGGPSIMAVWCRSFQIDLREFKDDSGFRSWQQHRFRQDTNLYLAKVTGAQSCDVYTSNTGISGLVYRDPGITGTSIRVRCSDK